MHGVGAEEDACRRVIVARTIIIQAGEAVIVLAGEAFAGGHAARLVAAAAVGIVELVAHHTGAIDRIGDGDQHAAECVGQQVVGRAATAVDLSGTQQAAAQVVVGGLALAGEGAGAIEVVGMLFQPESVDGDGRSRAGLRAAQHALAAGVVDVPLLVA